MMINRPVCPRHTSVFAVLTITGPTIMKLVDAGKISLEQPVTKYLPEFRMASPEYRDITVRMLLNHSAGLPGSTWVGGVTKSYNTSYPEQVLETLATERMKHAPGFMNVYCNDCFTLAEKIVETVSGKSFSNFLTQEIFVPLGMNHTATPIVDFPAGSYYAQTVVPGTDVTQEVLSMIGTGGLYSTPSDLLQFARVFTGTATASVLSKASIAAMANDETAGKFKVTDPNEFRYGLGWDSVGEAGLAAVNIKGWTKAGATNLYSSTLIIDPDDKLAAAVTITGPLRTTYAAIAHRTLYEALKHKGKLTSLPQPNFAQTCS